MGDDATGGRSAAIAPFGAGERWALAQVRRHGVAAFIAGMTSASVLVSGTVVTVSLAARDDFDEPAFWVPSLLLGTLMPAVLAPPLLLFTARLVARLDEATQQLQLAAVTDPLTGVANRRGFFEALDALHGNEELEIGMIDLDDFKALNDEHGHSAGDEALRTVARWLVDLVGDAGTVGRIGGDEFAFVAAAGRVPTTPDRQRFEHDDIRFTASIGRSRGNAADPEAALLAADSALYEHKRTRPVVRVERRRLRRTRRLER